MGWDKPKPNGFGGFKSDRNDRGQKESLHGTSVKKNRIHGDHVHFHKDGATVTKGGRKYTTSRKYCSNCAKDTSQRSNDGSTWYCSLCESTRSSYPKGPTFHV